MSGPVLPEHILKLMTPAERRRLGKAGRTMGDIEQETAIKNEAELQSQLRNLLALRDILPCIPTYGKRTGILPGWPDITFAYGGVPCAWEVKFQKNSLQEVQQQVRAKMEKNGWRYAVIRSVAEAKEFLNQVEKGTP